MDIKIPQDDWFNAGKGNVRIIDGIKYKFVYADPKTDYIKCVEVSDDTE